MAKGQKSKIDIQNKILEIFPKAFIYNKEIRIPMIEDSEEIQIKVTLTAAKENVYSGQDNATPGIAAINFEETKPIEQKIVEPTQEEKNNVRKLMETFGL